MPIKPFSRFSASALACAVATIIAMQSAATAEHATAPQASQSTIATQTEAPAAMAMQEPAETSSGTERSSYNSVRVDGQYIAMTFDDGPRPNEKDKSGNEIYHTPRLLDILKERHIHATFFVVGTMVQEHPEILQRAVAEGHEIGNHSWDHKSLPEVARKLGDGGLKHELTDTSELISKVTGKPVTLMRPPFGATNPRLSRAFEKEYGMKVILWSVDPLDWKRPGPQVVEQRILAGTKPGAIILAHDIHHSTIEAMPATLDALLAKGFKFVTVSELLAMESKNPAPAASPSPAAAPAAQKSSKSKKKAA